MRGAILAAILGAIGLLAMAASAWPASAETRVALVIGNAAYEHVSRLNNPVKDARAMGEALQGVGFDVQLVTDQGFADLSNALKVFTRKARGADMAVLYYSGHGIEIGETNYLIPVDAKLESDSDVDYEAVALDLALRAVEGARLRLVILDACRNNPFAAEMRVESAQRTIGRGLARVEPSGQTLVAYAAKDKTTADDGNGEHSPFTTALLKHVAEPGVEVPYIFREVHDDVLAATGRRQEPFVYGSLGAEKYYFVPPKENVAVQPVMPSPGAAGADSDAAQVEFWKSVANSTDPADLKDYLAHYPDGIYRGLAERRLAMLANAAPSPAAPPPVVARPKPQPAVEAPTSPAEQIPAIGQSFRDCSECPEMVVLPAGSFTMGSPASEQGRDNDEGPQHLVTIGRPFLVGKFEVTREEFAAFVSETGYAASRSCWVLTPSGVWKNTAEKSWRDPGYAQTDRDPVVCIAWRDAQAYLAWLSRKSGKTYRLISEAEWEYAARAGTLTSWPWGESSGSACEYANVGDRAAKHQYPDLAVHDCDDGAAYSSAVGRYRPNDFGLHDMIGNVWEWVADCWHDNYAGAPLDGQAWSDGECSKHALRGGSWYSRPKGVRVANRDKNDSSYSSSNLGFRVARNLAAAR